MRTFDCVRTATRRRAACSAILISLRWESPRPGITAAATKTTGLKSGRGLLDGNNYDNRANQIVAKNLKEKLLLAHGTTDSNVPRDTPVAPFLPHREGV